MVTQLPSQKGAEPPIFGQYMLWPNGLMDRDAVSREVGLSPSEIVLDGTQLPLKCARPAVFGPCTLWPNGWMDEDATWYRSRTQPRPHCVRRGPSSPTRKSTTVPLFSAHVYWGHGRPSQLLLSSCSYFGNASKCQHQYTQVSQLPDYRAVNPQWRKHY